MSDLGDLGQSVSPRPGERWRRKGTVTFVTILYCVGPGPFGSPRQVQWANENGQGKDSLPSFLGRFEVADA